MFATPPSLSSEFLSHVGRSCGFGALQQPLCKCLRICWKSVTWAADMAFVKITCHHWYNLTSVAPPYLHWDGGQFFWDPIMCQEAFVTQGLGTGSQKYFKTMEVSIVLFVAPVFSRSQVAATAVQQVAESMCKTLKNVEAPASIGGPVPVHDGGGLICVQELKSFFEWFYCHGSGGVCCFLIYFRGPRLKIPEI